MKRTLTALSASLVLMTGLSAAQAVSLQGRLHRTVSPTNGTYDLTTGFKLGAPSYRSGPATIFDNTDGVNYYFSTLGPTEEWIDSFAFVADEISGYEQINGFEFHYCSLFQDASGDSVNGEFRFYEDNPGFVEPTGWTDPIFGTVQNSACTYLLPGLPGDTSGTGISCWFVNVDLSCGFECTLPQETAPGGGNTSYNGFGWMMKDPTGVTNTGPYLGSKYLQTTPGYGTRDLWEFMDLAVVGSEFQGTFFFGSPPKVEAVFDLILYGDGIPDTDVINPDVPNTGDVLCLGSDIEFRNGNTVTWALDDLGGTAIFPSSAYAMLIGKNGSSAGYGSTAGPGTTLLVDPGSFVTPPTPLVMGGIVPSVTTPSLPGLPLTIWAQAMGFNGGIGAGNAAEASNALRHNN